jgi:mRNA interferase RelE/StbE
MTFQVILTQEVTRQLSKLEKTISNRITDKLQSIRGNPYLYVRKLRGSDFYRLRVGDYRIIMTIDNGKMIILVIEVGHRRNIYKNSKFF